eukprot:TRINITY_DN134699_c0_g1_i1.p1 TRINITY_DN134699_c0_g1~~TRINITY_DN134699_c0_g1_i1.p1  ORF type:complete len:111 (+),score=13.57 TRINITY_DN134699_c0_g1_i1:11-343(+)
MTTGQCGARYQSLHCHTIQYRAAQYSTNTRCISWGLMCEKEALTDVSQSLHCHTIQYRAAQYSTNTRCISWGLMCEKEALTDVSQSLPHNTIQGSTIQHKYTLYFVGPDV